MSLWGGNGNPNRALYGAAQKWYKDGAASVLRHSKICSCAEVSQRTGIWVSGKWEVSPCGS